jgi:hypothetical protein
MNVPKKGLGGILIVVAVWLFANPARTAYYLVTAYLPMLSNGGWDAVAAAGTTFSPPSLSVIIPFEIACNVAILAFNLVVISHFFRRSAAFPKLVIALILVSIAYVFVDARLLQYVPAYAANFIADMQDELDKSVLGGWIWIPYFLISARVKNTFVE